PIAPIACPTPAERRPVTHANKDVHVGSGVAGHPPAPIDSRMDVPRAPHMIADACQSVSPPEDRSTERTVRTRPTMVMRAGSTSQATHHPGAPGERPNAGTEPAGKLAEDQAENTAMRKRRARRVHRRTAATRRPRASAESWRVAAMRARVPSTRAAR